MKRILRKILLELRLPALYMLLFPLYFGTGWAFSHLNKMFAYPLALLLLLYFPALLMLGKTRSRLEAFTITTMREGTNFLAIFAGIIVAEHLLPFLQHASPFDVIYPVMLCVKTLMTLRETPKVVER